MDSFIKDVLSAIILASWVFPVLYLTLALVAGKLAAFYRRVRGVNGSPPLPRSRRNPASAPASSGSAPIVASVVPAARHSPVPAVGAAMPTARLARPRLASRWKSSHRVSASAC